MKNYTDSDYALNKVNKDAIVYKFADGVVEVTLAGYLAENPGKTEADFRALKELSDADYFERDREDYRQTYKNVSIHGLDETEVCSVPSPEDELIEQPEQAAIKTCRRDLGLRAFDALTEVQRRRYRMYHVEGLTEDEIAEKERTSHQAVSQSLIWAEKKIKKVLAKSKK